MEAQPVLPTEPVGIGGILDAGISLFRESFMGGFLVVLVGLGVAALMQILMTLMIVNPANIEMVVAEEGLTPVILVAMLGYSILYGVAYFTAYGGLIHYQWQKAMGDSVEVSAALGHGLSRVPGMFGSAILLMLAILVGMLLLIIPGLILMVTLSLTFIALIVERLGPLQSLRRSHGLIWGGHFWRAVVVLTVMFFIVVVIAFALGAIPGFLLALLLFTSENEPTATFQVVSIVIELFLNALTLPITTAMAMALYSDIRLRREGGDLEARLEGSLQG